eukprot:3574363-Rhodomonas_salina.1
MSYTPKSKTSNRNFSPVCTRNADRSEPRAESATGAEGEGASAQEDKKRRRQGVDMRGKRKAC